MTSSLDLIRGRQVVQTLTNQSGGGVIAGDVVIIDDANDESFTTTTTAAYNASRVGIALDTIAAAAAGRILLQGYAPLVNVSASATRKYYLLTHTVAKQATSQAAYAAGAFGQVIKAGTSPSAIIFPVAQVGSAGVARSGSTTGNNLAVWNGNNADSIKDGGSAGYPAEGRLTLTSGTPVTTSDVTAAGTLYYTPYVGDRIALYNGSSWDVLSFTEKSLSLTLTSAAVYDIFAYNNSGTVTLESLVWTNPTTRATALAYQNGVLCKTGALTRRYLGTICASGTNVTEDSLLHRYVWNYYNRLARPMLAVDTTDLWHYPTATWRAANNSTANRLQFVIGVQENQTLARVVVSVYTAGATANTAYVGIALDATNTTNATTSVFAAGNSFVSSAHAEYIAIVPIGYHYLQWVEYANVSGSGADAAWYGDAGGTQSQSGISGSMMG